MRSVAITLAPAADSRYGKAAIFRGRVVPALAAEPVALYVGGRDVTTTLAEFDGTFRLRLRRVRTPGPYEARTPVAASAPVALRVHPVLRAAFVGTRAVGGRLALAARVRPAAAGTLSIRLYRDGRLVRNARRPSGGQAGRGHRPPRRLPRGRWRSARTGLAGRGAHRARPRRPRDSRDMHGDGLMLGSLRRRRLRLPPLLSFAALNSWVSQEAVVRRASAGVRPGRPRRPQRRRGLLGVRLLLRGRAGALEVGVRAGGGRAGARPRAGAASKTPALSAAATAAFRGLRAPLLIRLAGGVWVRGMGSPTR